VPLEIIDSPYRELVAPIERYLDELDARWDNDRITVVIPEFVVGLRSASNILHGQSALGLKLALLGRPNTIVTSVPFHVGTPVGEDEPAPRKQRALTADTKVIEQGRLSGRYAGVAATSIAEAPLRTPMKVAGEITGMRVVPRAGSPSLEVTVNDGTGLAIAVFTGRTTIPGVQPGKGVVLEGVARQEGTRLLLLNPTYQLLS
jgi:hypothetical protein